MTPHILLMSERHSLFRYQSLFITIKIAKIDGKLQIFRRSIGTMITEQAELLKKIYIKIESN